MTKKLIRITTVPNSLRGLLKGQLKFMSQNGYDVTGISSPGPALEDVKTNEGVRTIAVEMTRTISPLKDLKALILLLKILYKEKPDIVHTHTPKAGLLGMLASKIIGVPYRLHTVAGMPLMVASGTKRKILNLVEKLTYKCATKVYPNSYGLETIILANGFTTRKKLKVIGNGSSNGIDTSVFNPNLLTETEKEKLKSSLGIKQDEFIFVFVGRLVGDKGINELVSSFIGLTNCSAKLLLVGPYEEKLDPLLPETLKQIDENPHIISVGYQNDVIPYFSISNVLTFPSYREGFPNVVMQASAMKLNSIVSDINGCNEIIEDGLNGWIVPAKNVDLLRSRMLWCLKNQDESNHMGEKGREIMQTKYERSFVWNEILNEYRKLR